jgi:hypothetical protein
MDRNVNPPNSDLIRSKSTLETYNTLCGLLEKQKKVYYSRFGDGDLTILMGKDQANHTYSESLAEEIYESLSIEDPQFLRGTPISYPEERWMTKGLFARFYYNDIMRDFIKGSFDFSWPVIFENGWFPNYYSAFKPVEMNLFLDRFIRPKKKMFIGSVPESEVRKLVGEIHVYIPVPRKNSYDTIDTWWPEILKHIDSVELVLPAAGMATRVICKRLWKMDKVVHCLDLGSIVDAVSSFPSSRTWIRLKKHALNRILLREYRDNSISYWIKYALKETGLICRYYYYKWDPLKKIPILPNAKLRRSQEHVPKYLDR